MVLFSWIIFLLQVSELEEQLQEKTDSEKDTLAKNERLHQDMDRANLNLSELRDTVSRMEEDLENKTQNELNLQDVSVHRFHIICKYLSLYNQVPNSNVGN